MHVVVPPTLLYKPNNSLIIKESTSLLSGQDHVPIDLPRHYCTDTVMRSLANRELLNVQM